MGKGRSATFCTNNLQGKSLAACDEVAVQDTMQNWCKEDTGPLLSFLSVSFADMCVCEHGVYFVGLSKQT